MRTGNLDRGRILRPLLPLILAGVTWISPALAQEHDHGAPEVSAEHSDPEVLGGVPRDFLERPIGLDSDLVRVPHRVGAASEDALAYYQQGLSYLYLYHRLNAIRSFNHALRLDPSLLPAYAGLSRALAAHGARAEGREVVRRGQAVAEELGAAADPTGRLLVELRAQALGASSDGERDAYRDALDRALQEDPDDVELRMIRALNSRGEQRRDRLHDVLKRVPDHAGAHHELIHFHEGRRESAQAVEHGRILAELAPSVAHGRHMYGHNLMRVGRVDEAKLEFAAADSLERAYFERERIPEHYDWHHPHNLHLLALTYWHLGQTDEAEAVLRRRAALEDREGRKRPSFLVQLGEFMMAEGRADDALAVAEGLLGSDGFEGGGSRRLQAQAHLLEAEARLLRGELDEARAAFASAEDAAGEGGGAMGISRWKDRVETQLLLHAGSRRAPSDELEEVITELRRDRGPDGWITSLLHLHALAQSASAAEADEVFRRVVRAMEEHDPSFEARVGRDGTIPASAPGGVNAQSKGADEASEAVRSLRIQPLRGPIQIDGRLSESDWAEAPLADGFVQQVPDPGRPASLETEARVLMSDDAVYVGVRLYDPAPDSIVAQLARRGGRE